MEACTPYSGACSSWAAMPGSSSLPNSLQGLRRGLLQTAGNLRPGTSPRFSRCCSEGVARVVPTSAWVSRLANRSARENPLERGGPDSCPQALQTGWSDGGRPTRNGRSPSATRSPSRATVSRRVEDAKKPWTGSGGLRAGTLHAARVRPKSSSLSGRRWGAAEIP